ncbi:MAG: DUF362 domain-containing protein [Candidatus Bathyarchaeia archaeon]|jgi:uncharacterized Fe-S center protein
MTKSRVFFTDRKAEPYYNMLDKLEHVLKELAIPGAIQQGDKIMIKTHFGQWGNTNYIRPAYVRKVVELVRSKGGEPFVAESCGLGYGGEGSYGGRTTAPEYVTMAALNGFSEGTVGAPIIMADGYWGTDTFDIEIDGKFVKKVDVASAVLDCDRVIVLSHVKGHLHGGIAGSLKNLGIGLVGKRGKATMHSFRDVKIDPQKCRGPECSKCLHVCPVRCITMKQKAEIDSAKCISCIHCRSICSKIGAKAISITWRPDHEQAPWFVENALGVVQSIGAEKFYYINLAIDISDKCDCWNVGPTLLVHDIGIFGSRDPVAVDQACFDAVNKAEPNPDSIVSRIERGRDKFAVAHDSKDPKTGKPLHLAEIQLDHAEKMGLGKRDYELITLTKAQPKGYSPS